LTIDKHLIQSSNFCLLRLLKRNKLPLRNYLLTNQIIFLNCLNIIVETILFQFIIHTDFTNFKMKYTLIVISFATFLTCTFAAVALGPAETLPDHPDQCYDSQNNQFYEPGETWQLNYCGIATCSTYNHTGTPTMMVEYASCGVAVVDPPCYMVEDKTKAYPDCCPQPVCPEDDSAEVENKNLPDEIDEQAHAFLNEIEDDDEGDSIYNHKYMNKLVDEENVKDASRLTEREEDHLPLVKQTDSLIPTNVNRYQITETSETNNDNVGNHDFKIYEKVTGQKAAGKTMQQMNEEYIQAIQNEFLRSYPQLRKISPRFNHRNMDDLFKDDDHFQWF